MTITGAACLDLLQINVSRVSGRYMDEIWQQADHSSIEEGNGPKKLVWKLQDVF